MSTGPRIPLAQALTVSDWLLARIGTQHGLQLVGSARRGNPDVGDLEYVTLMPDDPKRDALYHRLNDLFGDDTEAPIFMADLPAPERIGRVAAGLKPGFKYAKLVLVGKSGAEVVIEINRAANDGFGWKVIMRTGPEAFGVWFLWQWKQKWGIPIGEKHPASVDGLLVDQHGHVVPVPTEAEAFEKCGLPYIPPERRAAHVEAQRAMREVRR